MKRKVKRSRLSRYAGLITHLNRICIAVIHLAELHLKYQYDNAGKAKPLDKEEVSRRNEASGKALYNEKKGICALNPLYSMSM